MTTHTGDTSGRHSVIGKRDLPRLLDVDSLADRLGVTSRHIRRLVTERRIPFVKVGRFVRFDPAAIADWLSRHRVDSIA